MNRISVQDVKDAVNKTGLKLVQHIMVHGDGRQIVTHACGIGVLYYDDHIQNTNIIPVLTYDCKKLPIFDWATNKYNAPYVRGFMDGFDDSDRNPEISNQQQYIDGFKDGMAVWNALKDYSPSKSKHHENIAHHLITNSHSGNTLCKST